MRLLATKQLSGAFKARLLSHQFSLVEQTFIEIIPIKNPNVNAICDNVIFTSQNAVKIVLSIPRILKMIKDKTIYCVGEKTALLLSKNGQKVTKMTQNSSELAHFLSKKYKNEAFSYFCGKLRTPNLEEILPQNNNTIEAVQLYETQLKGKRVKGHFDGVLFFSPSGVRGYALDNNFENTHSFCIGPSTAKEVALHTPNFTVAKTPTESQLLLSIKNHNIPHEE